MRILIAGCGYTGIRLAALLHRAGHTVFGLRRSPPSPASPFLHWWQGDLTQANTFTLPPNLDVAVLSAGLQRDAPENYHRLFVDGYQNLLRHLQDESHPIQRVVLISTTGVFAEQQGGWVDESSPVNHNHQPGRYYLAAETIVQSSPWPATVVRFSGIYGPDRIRLIREVMEGRALLHPPPVHYVNHLHVDDAAGIVAHVMHHTHPESMYVASDLEPADRNDVLTWIARQVRTTPPSLARSMDEKPARRSGNKRCNAARLLASGYTFLMPTFREGYLHELRNLKDTAS